MLLNRQFSINRLSLSCRTIWTYRHSKTLGPRLIRSIKLYWCLALSNCFMSNNFSIINPRSKAVTDFKCIRDTRSTTLCSCFTERHDESFLETGAVFTSRCRYRFNFTLCTVSRKNKGFLSLIGNIEKNNQSNWVESNRTEWASRRVEPNHIELHLEEIRSNRIESWFFRFVSASDRESSEPWNRESAFPRCFRLHWSGKQSDVLRRMMHFKRWQAKGT